MKVNEQLIYATEVSSSYNSTLFKLNSGLNIAIPVLQTKTR